MENPGIKYCVTSFTDLLGFSNHIEIGNDLRTNIGKEIIKRLKFLEKSVELFIREKKSHSEHFPKNINYTRINDSLILTLDLPEFITPRIGDIFKEGITTDEMRRYFPSQDFATFKDFEIAYRKKITDLTLELTQFIGLSARIHSFVNRKENENFFPGAKTVIASGYRKSFITSSKVEDYFSANFSFSNAYIAESFLKGQKMFIDNNILRMLSFNQYTKNILKISSFVYEQYSFDPFTDDIDPLDTNNKYIKGEAQSVILFRKKYLFREVNPGLLSFLQLFPFLLPFLNGDKNLKELSKEESHLFREIYSLFKDSVKTKDIIENRKNFFYFRFDIEDNIEEIAQAILTDE